MKNSTYLVAISLMGLIACGDDDPETMDASLDAGVDATFDAGSDSGTPACAKEQLLVTISDFVTAEAATVNLTSGAVSTTVPLADQDSVPSGDACTPVLLERGNGQVLFQDPSALLSTLETRDVNPPNGTGSYQVNPVKVLPIDAQRAYLVSQQINQILILDPQNPTAQPGIIDLSGFLAAGDVDGSVDASDAIRIGDRVFVALGNYWFDAMNGFAQTFEGSVLAVIDTTTDSLVDMDPVEVGIQGIDLAFENPWRGLVHDVVGSRLLVGATGASGVNDGAVESIDLATLAPAGAVLLEDDLGSEILGIAGTQNLVVLVGNALRAFAFADLSTTSAVTGTVIDANVPGFGGVRSLGDGVVRWGTDGIRTFAVDGQENTPGGGGPITVGTLPVTGVVGFP